MAKRKTRRQSHGSAWHWKQTDCWYYTLPGTKRRVALFDDDGQRIKGQANKKAAELALARIKLSGGWDVQPQSPVEEAVLVARVCSDYLTYCERSLAAGRMSRDHASASKALLNDLCRYCGALPVHQLKKGHLRNWIDSHAGWKSPASQRNAIAIVLAAFNRAEADFGIANPLQGFKKPRAEPRLNSFTKEEEAAIYGATDQEFRDFLFAAIHTGLRPFCELARMTSDMVVENERGMMWRVYSSKTKKTRVVPVLPQVAELTRRLMTSAPKGSGRPLFVNPQGNPWKKVTGVSRFLAIKRSLGWDKHSTRAKYSTYTARHTYVHRMLGGAWTEGVGCSIEVLAEMIGDTPHVAYAHYGREWAQHFQEPLWRAVGLAAKPTPEAKPRRAKRAKAKQVSRVRRSAK